MKNQDIPDKFVPDQHVKIGKTYEDPDNNEKIERFGSLLDYAVDILTESSFQLNTAIEGYRGQTLIYKTQDSILAITQDEKLGIDYYQFHNETDIDPVIEELYTGEKTIIPGVKNDMHKTLAGDQAYEEIHKILEAEKKA